MELKADCTVSFGWQPISLHFEVILGGAYIVMVTNGESQFTSTILKFLKVSTNRPIIVKLGINSGTLSTPMLLMMII